jgi:hypothetical protein
MGMGTFRDPWGVKEGDRYMSSLTGKTYELSRFTEFMAVLESVDGKNRVITELDNLGIFYKHLGGKKPRRARV